jgi:hypothetical protein
MLLIAMLMMEETQIATMLKIALVEVAMRRIICNAFNEDGTKNDDCIAVDEDCAKKDDDCNEFV